jgi:acyl-CoA hydrolase
MDWALVEAADVTNSGEILLTSAVGAAPAICARAGRILIERNRRPPEALRGFHDIYEPADPPARREIPIYTVRDRIGARVVRVGQARIDGRGGQRAR